jgi:hypothetical protein
MLDVGGHDLVKDVSKAREWLEEYLSNLDEYEQQPKGWLAGRRP